MVAPLLALTGREGRGGRILVGPETGDDAGVYELGDRTFVATVDFVTPVCDDPRRYGRVAAVNSISDIYAMGGRPLFALNVCCFPGDGVPDGVLSSVLEGGAEAIAESGAVLLGGHTVEDRELKFGLAVVGDAEPDRLLTLSGARPGDRLLLTKPLGTGILINAFKFDKLDEQGLEPALLQMERLNDRAGALALEHGAHAATDVTGFGLVGHALNIARASGVGVRVELERLPIYDSFYRLVEEGITTGCTAGNRANSEDLFRDARGLSAPQLEVLFDPQTSGGLLIAADPESADALLGELRASGHTAAEIGEVIPGPPSFEVY